MTNVLLCNCNYLIEMEDFYCSFVRFLTPVRPSERKPLKFVYTAGGFSAKSMTTSSDLKKATKRIHFFKVHCSSIKLAYCKTVLLRDRKKRTTCRVASAHSSCSVSGGHPVPTGPTPVPAVGGLPQSQPGGTHILSGVPPGKDLGPGTWERTWDWGTPRKDLDQRLGKELWTGVPPPPQSVGRTKWKHYLPSYFVRAW